VFSDAEFAAVNLSESIQRHQSTAGTSDLSYKVKQHSAAGQPGPDLKLSVISKETEISGNAELVECLLETAKHSSVSFKFNHFTDQPNDVAASLVSKTPLHMQSLSF